MVQSRKTNGITWITTHSTGGKKGKHPIQPENHPKYGKIIGNLPFN